LEKYTVWCPELGGGPEDGKTISANDHEDAACIWARREDAESANYWIVGGDGTTVAVRGPGGLVLNIRVTGEPSIDYLAREVARHNAGDKRGA
jgi:hypothetical protein